MDKAEAYKKLKELGFKKNAYNWTKTITIRQKEIEKEIGFYYKDNNVICLNCYFRNDKGVLEQCDSLWSPEELEVISQLKGE